MTSIEILSMCASSLALVISILSYRLRSAKSRTDSLQYLQLQANTINEAFVKFEVRSPYEAFLNIPQSETKDARAKMVLLILQLNLLRSAFNSRNNLTKEQFTDYANWGSTILRPWIESDESLRKAYQLWVTSGDGGTEYTAWLKTKIPVIGENVLSNN